MANEICHLISEDPHAVEHKEAVAEVEHQEVVEPEMKTVEGEEDNCIKAAALPKLK
jgi:hypothetical protein